MNSELALGRLVVVAAAIIVLHVGLVSGFRISGVAAELPLGLAAAAGLAGGVERGAVYGFAVGLIVDMFVFTPVGLSALVFGFVAWVAGHVFLDRIEESVIAASLTVGVATAVGLLLFVGLGLALGQSALSEAPITRIVLVASLINAMVSPLLMGMSHWMWGAGPLDRTSARFE